MLGLPNGLADRTSPVKVAFLGLLATGVFGVADYLTGIEVSFSIFYLIPVAYTTWYGSRRMGFAVGGVSALVWLVVDAIDQTYSHWLVAVWNAAARLAFFLVTGYLLGEVKQRLLQEVALARTDGLTEVLNARAFKDVSARLLQLAARNGHTTALGYIDIDNFKAINDERGHSEGDLVLKTVADTITRCIRSADVVGRLGGDEFAIFMPEVEHADVKKSYERIRKELMREVGSCGWPIGFSIGVAVFHHAPADIDDALKVADHLMYRVKTEGKNGLLCEEQKSLGGSAMWPKRVDSL